MQNITILLGATLFRYNYHNFLSPVYLLPTISFLKKVERTSQFYKLDYLRQYYCILFQL